MEIERPASLWAKSTEARLPQYLDEFLFRYKQSGVRTSTQMLLVSLFKKGNTEQRRKLLTELASRIQTTSCTGKASEQIIGLLRDILELKCRDTCPEQTQLFDLLVATTKKTFTYLTSHADAAYFRFCENQLEIAKSFRPYLFELNGCVRCYGDIENSFTPTPRRIEEITEQLRVSGNRLIFHFKMVYELKDVVVKFVPKNATMPPGGLVVWYADNEDKKIKRFGGVQQPIALTTNQLQVELENLRGKGGKCMLCGRSEENSSVCGSCRKNVEIELRYKRLGGQPERIMRELADNYKQLAQARKNVESVYQAVSNGTTLPMTSVDLVETERVYQQIMLNLSLLEPNSEARLNGGDYRMKEGEWNCFSCTYIQAKNLLAFLSGIEVLRAANELQPKLLNELLEFLLGFYETQQLPNSLHRKLLETLGVLLLLLSVSQPTLVQSIFTHRLVDSGKVAELLKFLVLKLREFQNPEKPELFNLAAIKELVLEVGSRLAPSQRVQLAAAYLAKKDQLDIFYSTEQPKSDKLKSVKKLSDEEVLPVAVLLNFEKQLYLNMPVTNGLLLLMCLLPIQLLPESTIDMTDEALIPYINNKLPKIDRDLTVVFSPKPMLPLTAFRILPSLATSLAPRDGLLLVMEILKFKGLWNINLYNTLQSCDTLMETLDKGEQLRMCLWGLLNVYQEYFLTKLHRILVPKRRQFIIKVDPPERELKKMAVTNNQQWECPMVTVRELKTQELPGYTMKEVKDWVTQHLPIAMGMDLIVEGWLINDESVPIEMVYKKLVAKEEGKLPPQLFGQLETFKVIYRPRGIFGEPTEKDAGSLGDEQKDTCLSFAPILTETVGENQQTCGLDIIFRLFKRFEKSKEDRDVKKTLLDIMNMVFKSESVRLKAIERDYADILIRATLRFLSSNDDQSAQFSESLLETVEKLIDQANRAPAAITSRKFSTDRKGSTDMDIEQDKTIETAYKNVDLVITKITEDGHEKSKQVLELVKLLPFSSKDLPELSQKIFNYLQPVEVYNNMSKGKLDRLYAFLEALPESYVTFKRLCYESGLTAMVLESLNSIFPNEAAIVEATIVSNEPQLVVNLSFLRSLARGYEDVQKDLLDQKLIPILHKLSLSISKHFNVKIPTYSEEIVKNLAEKQLVYPEAAKQARALLQRHRQQNKKRALATRQQALEQMKKKRANAAAKNAIDMAPMKKQYLVCVSCKEGYESKNNLMGIYSYWIKQEIAQMDSWWLDGKKSTSITSLSSFTPIHFECHREAQAYNSQEKKPEWEGAQIRNSDTRCNNWIPIRGPNTSQEEFDKISRKYFEFNKSGGYWAVLNDLKGLLVRLASQEELPKDSNGSIPNCMKLVAVLVMFAAGIMKKSEEIKFLNQGVIALQNKAPQTLEQLYVYLVGSLFTVPFGGFEAWRQASYRLILAFANQQCKDQKVLQLQIQNLYSIQKPLFILLAILQFTFETIHQRVERPELLLGLEEFVSKNLEQVLTAFEKFAQLYREDLTKKKSFEEFESLFGARK